MRRALAALARRLPVRVTAYPGVSAQDVDAVVGLGEDAGFMVVR